MRYFKILVFLVLVAFVGLGVNGGCSCPGPISVGLGKITGYVSSSVLETTRIPGAIITAVGGGKTYTTVTDEQGNYALFVPAGTYNISASKETFNADTEDGVSVTADGTKTVNFSLTTGDGGITEISISGVEIYTITHPNQFDIRSIRLDRNFKPDIESLLRSYYSNIRVNGTDYKSALILLAVFDPSPPEGAQGSRIYVGTTPNGPFILKTLGSGVITSMPQSIVTNSIGTLAPNTTYYIYPSLYGTWGENISEDCIEVSTPTELVLTEPENNANIYPGDVTFEWSSLGEGWEYSGEIRKEETGGWVLGFDTPYNYYETSIPSEAESGNYLWRVIGSYSGEESVLQYSISYPRRFTIQQSPE
ncbi:carboxypeptidase regulatory-like domain-containing protein [bacterium]|nr:carboxypeptidase regulatory-like domain-containing protein [bacterium]